MTESLMPSFSNFFMLVSVLKGKARGPLAWGSTDKSHMGVLSNRNKKHQVDRPIAYTAGETLPWATNQGNPMRKALLFF